MLEVPEKIRIFVVARVCACLVAIINYKLEVIVVIFLKIFKNELNSMDDPIF